MLPKSLLYSIFARIGGHGLDTDSFEALRASYRGKFLGKAVAYDNRQKEIPARFIQSRRLIMIKRDSIKEVDGAN